MTSETTAKKNTQKLQRAIVDGLEDVKAQDIVVFNTEHQFLGVFLGRGFAGHVGLS